MTRHRARCWQRHGTSVRSCAPCRLIPLTDLLLQTGGLTGWPARYTAADALEIHLASRPVPLPQSPGVFFEQAPFPQPGGMGKGKGTEEKCPQALKPHPPPPSKIIMLVVTHTHPSTCAPTYGCGPTAPRGWPGGAEPCEELVAHKVPRPGVDREQGEKEEITSVVQGAHGFCLEWESPYPRRR